MSKDRELLSEVVQEYRCPAYESEGIGVDLIERIEAHLLCKTNRKTFTKPTKAELETYARSIGFTIDGQAFIDYYDQKDWRVGSSPMKNWQASVRVWKRTASKSPQQTLVKARKDFGY